MNDTPNDSPPTLPTFTGWCCLWQSCGGVGVECVAVRGAELCVACAEREKVAEGER